MKFWPFLLTLAAASLLSVGSLSAQEWSTIKGTIIYGGKQLPKRMPLNVDKDREVCLKKGPLLDEKWVVDPKTKGVQHVLIWLGPDDAAGKLNVHPDLAKAPEKPFEMDQPCCQFMPHVFGVRAGQPLLVKNSDPIPHNIKWQGFRNPGGNVIIPASKSFTIKDLQPERLPMTLQCSIHPWMEARLAVFDHPYFAVTNEKGEFEIKNAPLGKLRLFVWQESAGYLGGKEGRKGKPIAVQGGETDLGKIEFAP
jgi:hypothetical protein